MTSLEHVSVEQSLNRSPSWIGDVSGDVAEAWGEVEVEVEEVGVGVAVTTAEEEQEQEEREEREREEVGIAVVGDEQDQSANALGSENDREHVEGRGGVDSFDESRSVARSALGSTSHSHSHCRSGSGSNSRSQSSVREVMEMGESSAATSWMQGEEVVVGRPSGDSKRRPSADRSKPKLDETIDVGREEDGESGAVRELGTEVVSQSHPRGVENRSRDVSRKEEVLVMQEEDIGEEWHPSRYNGKARLQDDEKAEGEKGEGEGEGEEDVGFVHALERISDGDQSLEMNEKGRSRMFGSSGRNTRHLRLEFKPTSPQPWDEIDPPADNNEAYGSDYYSTLNSQNFGTLQKNRRRPLIPHSTYYFGPPPPGSAYGTPPVGQIGIHHPREIVRVERDYAGGELVQFSPVFPLELEGRITPTQFHQTINDVNEILISAHSIQHSIVDNFLAVVTLQLSTLVTTSHYTKEMRRLKQKIEEQNTQLYNPVGLNILWPQKVAFLFLEIEYYASDGT